MAMALRLLRQLPARRGLRWASTGKRDFFQRINEQYLAHELDSLSEPAHRGERPMFNPKVQVPRVSRIAPEEEAPEDLGAFKGRRRQRPWLHYESLRGETYPSGEGKGGPQWQDLTHNEAQRLQEMYMRKRMLDRKILWLKRSGLPNPEKEAKMSLRRQQEGKRQAQAEQDEKGLQMYPLPYLDVPYWARRMEKMEDGSRKEELESRFRARIREEKLASAKVAKAAVPDMNGVRLDPIQRHVQKRLLRQRPGIHSGIEEALTRNSAQILYEHLKGVSISIVKVSANRPRQTQQLHYSLSSDHDPAWVQRQLDVLAPKLRSQLAVKVNMGQTPNIRFVPYTSPLDVRRAYLYPHARRIIEETPIGG